MGLYCISSCSLSVFKITFQIYIDVPKESNIFGRFCESVKPNVNIPSSQMLWVHFHSNQLRTGDGFLAIFSTMQHNQGNDPGYRL